MKYTAPAGKILLFDNSDVIVASYHDLACTSTQDANAYCTRQGDSSQPNECDLQGRKCTGTSKCEGEVRSVACALNVFGQTCSTQNQVFFNSGPYIPQ